MSCDMPDWLTEKKDAKPAVASPPAVKEGNDSVFGSTTSNGTASTVQPSFVEVDIETANPNAGGSSSAEMNTNNEGTPQFSLCRAIVRDSRLLIITILVIVGMNIPFLRYVFYPFDIFSTWIHEECHAFAALMVGARVERVLLYPDTSGLAYILVPMGASSKQAFVASAGYQGTAVVGTLLLLFRRTKRGPRAGMMFLGLFMLITTAIWTRNLFGVLISVGMALCLILAAWKLPSWWMNNLYLCLAVLTSMNAIANVSELVGSNQMVNGEPSPTDANSMAESAGGTAIIWIVVWLLFALLMTILGIIFAIPGPDEVADFAWCRACQKMGCFLLCNHRKASSSSSDSNNNDQTPAVTPGA